MRSTATELQIPHPARRGMFRHRLAREITVVLVAKLVLLLVGFWLFFGPQTRPSLTPEGILEHFSAAAPVQGPDA